MTARSLRRRTQRSGVCDARSWSGGDGPKRRASEAFRGASCHSGKAKTNRLLPMLGRSSGVRGAKYTRVRELPVLTRDILPAVDCERDRKPGDRRAQVHLPQHVPGLRVQARKRPLRSPPNTRPPPVATSEVVAARCSYFQMSAPVSGEIAWTVRAGRCRAQARSARRARRAKWQRCRRRPWPSSAHRRCAVGSTSAPSAGCRPPPPSPCRPPASGRPAPSARCP